VRWFVEMFSDKFSSSLFKLLEADSASAAEEAKHMLDKGLKVTGFLHHHPRVTNCQLNPVCRITTPHTVSYELKQA